MSALEIEGLRVEIGRRTVLDGIDHHFESGSFSLLVGASGSGKTTLLRAIAGLARPSAGRIAIDGRDASVGDRLVLEPHERGVGLLFQGGGLWPHLSVRKTLDYVCGARGLRGEVRAKRVAELIDTVELRGLEARRPGELSGGEAQRLGLARALACDPRVLLLDEPLGPLDARLRGALLERLGELHDSLSLTTIYVTHDPAQAERLADQVLTMEAGKLR